MHSNIYKASKSLISYQKATVGPDKENGKLQVTTIIEIASLKENDVWDFAEPSAGQKIFGCEWVYQIKTGAENVSVQRYKA